MLNNIDLLNLYKEEKTLVIGRPEVRTGLEEFPSFAEWKEEYIREYNETHETVDINEADARAEAAIEEAEKAIDQFEELTKEDVVNEAIVQNIKPVKQAGSKTELAREIFEQMYPQVLAGTLKRKDVIQSFISDAGLTSAGASTYYQKFKSAS